MHHFGNRTTTGIAGPIRGAAINGRASRVFRFFPRRAGLLCAVMLACAASAAFAENARNAKAPRVVVVPSIGRALDVVLDATGRAHVVYGRDQRIYYRSGKDGSWTPETLVSGDRRGAAGLFAGPRVALTKDGVAVIWELRGKLHAAASETRGVKTRFVYAPPRDKGAKKGAEGVALASDKDGTLYATWVDARERMFVKEKAAGRLYMAISRDGGFSWEKNRAVSPAALPVCVCCRPSLAVTRNGAILAAYRRTIKGIKEMIVLRSIDGGKTFTHRQVSRDRWFFDGCPGAGPSLASSPDGKRVAMLWRARQDYRVAVSVDGGASFAAPHSFGTLTPATRVFAGDDDLLLAIPREDHTRLAMLDPVSASPRERDETNAAPVELRTAGRPVLCADASGMPLLFHLRSGE